MKNNKQRLFFRIIFIIVLFLQIPFAFADTQIINEKHPHVIFTLMKNSDDSQFFVAKITVDHLDELAQQKEVELAFNSIRPILSVDHAELIQPKQGGDFYILKFPVKNEKSITFTIEGKWFIRKYSDAPSGYFMIENPDSQNPALPAKTISVDAQTILPFVTIDDHSLTEKQKENTAIEGNPTTTALTANTSLIVPLPVELQRREGDFVLNSQTKIIDQTSIAKPSADFFVAAIASATGFTLPVIANSTSNVLPNTIVLTTQGVDFSDEKQKKEGYILDVMPSYIILRAVTSSGFFYGLQSLRQLLPPPIFNHHIPSSFEWKIPSVFIRDYPRFEYRGLHLDVARHFVPPDEVKRLLDLMAIHKLNAFEWHLTDDEGWRIQINHYPALTEKGTWRGYDLQHHNEHDLLPAYGSGQAPYGGFYTQQEIRDIVTYAEIRHITIIPEIDMPGHARALIQSLPNDLIDTTDTSSYTSVQGYHDNVLSPCKSETFTVIDNILTEIAQLFPGKYIHIGGDEVPNGAWKNSCMAKKYSPTDPHFAALVQNDFLQKIQTILQSKNKIMAGWEEVASEEGTLAAPLRVYIWNTSKIDQAYQKAAHAGYEVIMAPAENLYFDLSYSADPHEPGQYWAGYVDTFSPYSLSPINTNKGQNDTVIKGVQGELWSEQIDSPSQLDYLAFPKIAGLAELAWTPANRRNWKNFYDRMREQHLLRLKEYGVQYRAKEFE